MTSNIYTFINKATGECIRIQGITDYLKRRCDSFPVLFEHGDPLTRLFASTSGCETLEDLVNEIEEQAEQIGIYINVIR